MRLTRQLRAKHAGNDPARPAESVENKITRIKAPLHGDLVDKVADLSRRHAIDAESRLLDIHLNGLAIFSANTSRAAAASSRMLPPRKVLGSM